MINTLSALLPGKSAVKKKFKKKFADPHFFDPGLRNYIVKLSDTVIWYRWFTSLFRGDGIKDADKGTVIGRRIRVGMRVGQKSRGLIENRL